MRRYKIEDLVGIFLILMVLGVAAAILAGCAGMTASEQDAVTTKFNSVMKEIFRQLPGGGIVNDITSIAGILWAGLFTKRKVGKKLQEMKDSSKGEFFAKDKKTA